jgi:hypothetical protein
LRKFGSSARNLPPMEWEVEPTLTFGKQGFLRVQDIMVLQILEANRWEKPIYFATTVSPDNKLGMDNFMTMEGLAFRIYPHKVNRVDQEKLRYNVFNVYKYRNLDDPKVYYDENVTRLIGNYRSAFLQLAIDDLYKNNKAGILATLDTMSAIIPESIFPIGNDDIFLQIGLLYHEAGRTGADGQPGDLEKRLEYLLSQPNVNYRNKIRYASVYAQQLQD